MIQRELAARGRGWENYYRARGEAQAMNKAKKLKREAFTRDQAAQAAQEAELAARQLGELGSSFKNLFSKFRGEKKATKSKKRKLEDSNASASPSAEVDPKKKKQKLALKPSPFSTSAPTETATKKMPLKVNVPPQASTVSSLSSPISPNRPLNAPRTSVAPKAEPTPLLMSHPPSRRSLAASAEPAVAITQARGRTSTPAVPAGRPGRFS
jgi:hypothetical protein